MPGAGFITLTAPSEANEQTKALEGQTEQTDAI